MSAQARYRTAAAFRAALEQRLRAETRASGVPLNRLRKEVAFERLLARLQHAAPDAWALKGGLALIARLGIQVRGTKDADTNWRATRRDLEEVLSAVEEVDLDDWFAFIVGDPRRMQGEGEQGALRYPVTTRLDGRTFEQLSLDVNVVGTQDTRPVELVTLRRNPFDFVDEPPLRVPMLTPGQQLAEKLHAYTRLYDGESSSRAKDLFDMLVIAAQVQLPRGAELTDEVRATFHVRATDWPPQLGAVPAEWATAWEAFVTEYPLRWTTLEQASTALQRFWQPVLTGAAAASNAIWRPKHWGWG